MSSRSPSCAWRARQCNFFQLLTVLFLSRSPDRLPTALARRIALSYGPSSSECNEAVEPGYGPSVLARSQAYPPGDWDQRVKLYSDGLLRGDWTPSFRIAQYPAPEGEELPIGEAIEKSVVNDDDEDWKFHCPVSIIFGLRDVALDPRAVLNGIEKHFAADSEDPLVSSALAEERITRLPNCGHWSILEDEGSKALDRVLARIID